MDDAKLKQLLMEDLEADAERIMEEVNSDPSLKDVKVPQEIHDRLFQQIREYEEQKAQASLSEEDKELIRLGKIYKKRRKKNKFIVLAVAIIAALAVSVTSLGVPEKVVETMKSMMGDRERTRINVDGEKRVETVKVSDEEEAYQLIDDTFNYTPARLYYLPDSMEFSEIIIEEGTQNARMYYELGTEKNLSYTMLFNYRDSSASVDTEDKIAKEYEKEVMEHSISVKKYVIEDDDTSRWRVEFQDQKVKCIIVMSGLTDIEAESVIENLHFFQ